MVSKLKFLSGMIDCPASERPVIGIPIGVLLVRTNLPTGITEIPCCWLRYQGGELRRHILLRSGDSYEPFEIPETSNDIFPVHHPEHGHIADIFVNPTGGFDLVKLREFAVKQLTESL